MRLLLEIKNLNINYKNSTKAVKNVNLTLEDNKIIKNPQHDYTKLLLNAIINLK